MTAATPGQAARAETAATRDYGEFIRWWEARGFADGQALDFSDARAAFGAGMRAARDLGAAHQPKPATVTLAFVDLRCSHSHHADAGVYRMAGHCRNCTSPVLGLHTVRHAADGGILGADCPVCGCQSLSWDRLATPDEIPADAGRRIAELLEGP